MQTRLYLLLERIGNLLDQESRAIATRHDLALAQLQALHYLSRANRFSDTLSALADFLGATKGTVSQTVTSLERKGLVERVDDARDRRVSHCRPTASGERLVREWLPPPALAQVDGEAAVGALEDLLVALIRARGGATFGVCRTCAHFRAEGPRCDLVQEPLAEAESALLCREHQPTA